MRVLDSWTAGTHHQLRYRVVEVDGIRRLEVCGPFDDDFHPPAPGHSTALAKRLMELFRNDEMDNVLPMRERKSG